MANLRPQMLVEELLTGIAPEKQDSMRAILENQSNYVAQLNEATFSGAIKSVPKLILPLARRIMTNVVADQLVGVQPLKERTGVYMVLKYVYANQSEIKFANEAMAQAELSRYNGLVSNDPDAQLAVLKDTDATTVVYPAGAEVAYISGVNQYAKAYESTMNNGVYANGAEGMSFSGANGSEQFRQTTLKFVQGTVTAKTRKLAAEWSLESAQDAQASMGINIEKEMIAALAQTIANDIDREILNSIENKVGYATNYSVKDSLGLTIADRYQALYTKIHEVSNRIAVRTRRGAANWMVVNPNVLTVLQTLRSFNFAPATSTYVDPTNVGLAGVIEGRFKVFTDIIRASNDVLVGYKGATDTDAGIIYMPYVPLEVSPTILNGDNFMPRVMLSTRYGLADNILGADAYFGKVAVDLTPATSIAVNTVV